MWVQAKVKLLVGGQAVLNAFRDKVHVCYAQNIVALEGVATYKPATPHGTEGHERLRLARSGTPAHPWDTHTVVLDPSIHLTDIGFPILDAGADPTGGMIFSTSLSSDPDLLVTAVQQVVEAVMGTSPDADAWIITGCDSPRPVFDAFLPEPGPALSIIRTRPVLKTSGIFRFRRYLVAFSDDANFSYVAFGYADWTLDIGGSVDWFATSTGNPKWIIGSAGASGDSKLTEIKHGKEAKDAHCEVRPPIAIKILLRDARG